MTRHVFPATRAEVADLLARRRACPFDGFMVDPDPARQVASLAQLREHLGEEPLRGPILSAEQLADCAHAHAEQLERESEELGAERERGAPLAERLAGHEGMLRMLGLAEPPEPEHPLSDAEVLELGPEMARLLGRPWRAS